MSIRNFLRLDKQIAEPDNNLVDAIGLIITGKKDFMQPPPSGGCFGYKDNGLTKHDLLCLNLSADFHHIHDMPLHG